MSRTRPLQHGDILEIDFPMRRPSGHEQEGIRPAVVIAIPEILGYPRYAVVMVAPLTRDQQQPWLVKGADLYPRLEAGAGGIPVASAVLLDQISSVDVMRIKKSIGVLTPMQYAPIAERINTMHQPEKE